MPAGGTASVQFPAVELPTPMSAELTVLIDGAAPFETDATNNSRSSTVEVTEHELVRSNVLVPALGGYGAQFNQHVYAPVTNSTSPALPRPGGEAEGARATARADLLQRFWEERRAERAPQNLASFVEVGPNSRRRRARRSTSRIRPRPWRDCSRTSRWLVFAGVLEDLVEQP